jgi:hypothetical protein
MPSYTVFKHRYKRLWSKILRQRSNSHFAQCQTCWELHKKMNSKTESFKDKVQAARDLRQHYQDPQQNSQGRGFSG